MPSLASPTLQQLHRLDRSSPDFHAQTLNVLYGEEYQKCVPDLQGGDLVWLVDYLDKALDDLDHSSPTFRKLLRELRRVCGIGGVLPASYTLSSYHLNIPSDPFTSGGFGDGYEGTLDGSRVCAKRVRVHTKGSPETAAKTFCREAVIWKYLTHQNVVPLLGVTIDPFQLVSDWVSGGNLPDHIRRSPDADLLGLLSDVAEGLSYLHSRNIVHGNLKGRNILVDDSGRARITEFGLARVTQSVSHQHIHTARWAAPEILNEGPRSKAADIFSFAMVMIEVFTGDIPFSDTPSVTAILAVTQGERPSRPTHPIFTANLWTLTQRCWDNDPHLRPEASEVSQILLTLERPAWKKLISHSLTADERTSLIVKIFSDRDEVEMVEHLSGDDAQAFVDAVSEVSPHSMGKLIIYEAEAVAVILALHMLGGLSERLTEVTIGTDNQAVLLGLRNQTPKPGHYLMDKIHDALEDFQVSQARNRGERVKGYRKGAGRVRLEDGSKGWKNWRLEERCKVTFVWTPGHEDIEGNEQADEAAKEAASGQSSNSKRLPAFLRGRNLPVSVSATRQLLKKRMKNKWKTELSSSPRYANAKKIDPTLPSNDFLHIANQLRRNQTSLLVQLRTGHIPLNVVLHRIKRSDTTECPHCKNGTRETIHHYLLSCPHYAGPRRLLQAKLRRDAYSIPFLLGTRTGIPHLLRYVSSTGRLKATFGEVRPENDFVLKEQESKEKRQSRGNNNETDH